MYFESFFISYNNLNVFQGRNTIGKNPQITKDFFLLCVRNNDF